jgi:hypothetical protein
MSKKKCCKSRPPCKNCPKRRKKAGSADERGAALCYGVLLVEISINGQRGCTANAPAGFAGEPACRRRQPASAIMAPLSVQNSSSG